MPYLLRNHKACHSERRYSRPASTAVEGPRCTPGASTAQPFSALTPSTTYGGTGNLLESNKKWAFAHSSLPPIAGALTAVQTEQTRYPLPYAACRRNSNPPDRTRGNTPPERLSRPSTAVAPSKKAPNPRVRRIDGDERPPSNPLSFPVPTGDGVPGVPIHNRYICTR